MLTKECHIKDILEHLEPTLLTRSYLNAMGSTNVRMLFYGMLRKEMDAPLDSCPAVIAFFFKLHVTVRQVPQRDFVADAPG